MKRKIAVVAALAAVPLLAGCYEPPNADNHDPRKGRVTINWRADFAGAYVPPKQREGDPQVCGHCGTGILGRPSAARVNGKLVTVHAECRRQLLEAARDAAKQDRQNARDERKAAIMRGDIA